MFAALNAFQVGGVFPAGQEAFTTAGTYSWTCPNGVTSVSVVAVGGGRGGGGGLGYKNNYAVTPGNSYTVVVGSATFAGATDSYFVSTAVVKGGAGGLPTGGTYTGDGGGNGGDGGNSSTGGGGAGGYAGNGGAGGSLSSGSSGSGGGGGGGGYFYDGGSIEGGGSGGGVGLLGQGSSGAGGSGATYVGGGGGGGSSGTAGGNYSLSVPPNGGLYGGGMQAFPTVGSVPGGGAVRIIWAGTTGITRTFPSTNTGDL